MHVSLAEALEVRGGPLHEEEIWAVLNQSAESLQELFRKGKPSGPYPETRGGKSSDLSAWGNGRAPSSKLMQKSKTQNARVLCT